MNTVIWTANGHKVTLQSEGAGFVIRGGGDATGAHNLRQALGIVGERVGSLLRGSHGLSGWSLTCTFAGVRLFYGDAGPNPGGPGGLPSEEAACANGRFDPRLQPQPALRNSIDIVRSCWSVAAAV